MEKISLENALEKKCENTVWLAWILFLTSSSILLCSTHMTSYTFLGGNPSFFCDIPELVEANWTREQKRKISNYGLEEQNCVYYAWNYSLLKDLSFDEALGYIKEKVKPEVIKCKNFIFDEEEEHQTVISEWDLVCDNAPLSSAAQSAVAIGRVFGTASFGLFSDRFGRKKIFVFAAILYAVSSTADAFVKSYTMFLILRLLLGFVSGGVLDASLTILLEITVKNYRVIVGSLFNLAYSFGMIYLALAAYFTNNWRQLQLAISVPLYLLFINCWFLPESPRWLITRGHFNEAAKIIGREFKLEFKEAAAQDPPVQPKSVLKRVVVSWKKFFEIFSSLELSRRLFICSYLWFLGCLYYYSLALNGANIDVNEYLFLGLNGIIETPGVLLPILLLQYFGRKPTGIALWIVASVTMLMTGFIPRGWPVMCVSLFGKIVSNGGFGLVALYTSELFPTEHRNFAIGISGAVAEVGALIAPYFVDILGKKAWWLPTTVSGFLALIGAILILFLPETRNTPMPDTISEMNLN